jgi:hypothetical protein
MAFEHAPELWQLLSAACLELRGSPPLYELIPDIRCRLRLQPVQLQVLGCLLRAVLPPQHPIPPAGTVFQ